MKPVDNTNENENGVVGNTILVAQPSPELTVAEPPPTETEQAQYFNVVYAAGAAEQGSSNLRKKESADRG